MIIGISGDLTRTAQIQVKYRQDNYKTDYITLTSIAVAGGCILICTVVLGVIFIVKYGPQKTFLF